MILEGCLSSPGSRGSDQKLLQKLMLPCSLPSLVSCKFWPLRQSTRFVFFFNWSTICLQYCVNFYSTAKGFSYTYACSCSFPLWLITGYWIEFSVLDGRTLLFIHPVYTSLHLLIPNSQSTPPCPLWQPQVCSLCLQVSFCFTDNFVSYFKFHIEIISYGICPFLYFPFWLTSPNMRISVSIYVAQMSLFHSL